jgi:7-keto-8-aminopelargonate synthetase-like enzyme
VVLPGALQVESGQSVALHPVTLGELVERWLCDVAARCERQRIAKANVEPALGNAGVSRLTAHQEGIDERSSLGSRATLCRSAPGTRALVALRSEIPLQRWTVGRRESSHTRATELRSRQGLGRRAPTSPLHCPGVAPRR